MFLADYWPDEGNAMIVAPADLKLVAAGARPTQESCAGTVRSGLLSRCSQVPFETLVVKSQWGNRAKAYSKKMTFGAQQLDRLWS